MPCDARHRRCEPTGGGEMGARHPHRASTPQRVVQSETSGRRPCALSALDTQHTKKRSTMSTTWRGVFSYVQSPPSTLTRTDVLQVQQVRPDHRTGCSSVVEGDGTRRCRETRQHRAQIPKVGERRGWSTGEPPLIYSRAPLNEIVVQVYLNPEQDKAPGKAAV